MSENNEKTDSHNFLLGMIIGGAIGAAVAYFFNSDDKEKAIKSIKEKAEVLLENFGELKEDLVDKTQEVKEAVEEKTQEIVEEVKEIPHTVETKIIPHNKKGFGKSFFKKGDALVKK